MVGAGSVYEAASCSTPCKLVSGLASVNAASELVRWSLGGKRARAVVDQWLPAKVVSATVPRRHGALVLLLRKLCMVARKVAHHGACCKLLHALAQPLMRFFQDGNQGKSITLQWQLADAGHAFVLWLAPETSQQAKPARLREPWDRRWRAAATMRTACGWWQGTRPAMYDACHSSGCLCKCRQTGC